MMCLRLYLNVVLRPVMNRDLEVLEDSFDEDQTEEDHNEGEDPINDSSSQRNRSRTNRTKSVSSDGEVRRRKSFGDDLRLTRSPGLVGWSTSSTNGSIVSGSTNYTNNTRLGGSKKFNMKRISTIIDPSGPKMINGAINWIRFYQWLGLINWFGLPFILSLLYKFCLVSFIFYRTYCMFMRIYSNFNLTDKTFQNPIFLFILAMSIISCLMHICVTIYTSSLKLSPMMKILETPKLCFISVEAQSCSGNNNLKTFVLFLVYHGTLLYMASFESLADFVDSFDPFTYIMDTSASILFTYYSFIGLLHMDFYIRSNFAIWLLTLRSLLEHRFAHCNRHHRHHQYANRLRLHQPLRNLSNRSLVLQQAARQSNNRNPSWSARANNHHASVALELQRRRRQQQPRERCKCCKNGADTSLTPCHCVSINQQEQQPRSNVCVGNNSTIKCHERQLQNNCKTKAPSDLANIALSSRGLEDDSRTRADESIATDSSLINTTAGTSTGIMNHPEAISSRRQLHNNFDNETKIAGNDDNNNHDSVSIIGEHQYRGSDDDQDDVDYEEDDDDEIDADVDVCTGADDEDFVYDNDDSDEDDDVDFVPIKSNQLDMYRSFSGDQRRAGRLKQARSARRMRQRRLIEDDSSSSKMIQFVSLDEIQKQLNNMDDHLEVLRSMQAASLVFVSLSAFFANGALFLFIYTILTTRKAYYHGTILILASINYIIVVLFCYLGDRLAYYGLSAFVQTVEDEYFLQGDIATTAMAPAPLHVELSRHLQRQSRQPIMTDGGDNSSSTAAMESSTSVSNSNSQHYNRRMLKRDQLQLQLQQQQQKLFIKRKDVLFCREFLHQFENHLATPWTKLTVKTHLHIMGTFVTLIAAQIIFDHEH